MSIDGHDDSGGFTIPLHEELVVDCSDGALKVSARIQQHSGVIRDATTHVNDPRSAIPLWDYTMHTIDQAVQWCVGCDDKRRQYGHWEHEFIASLQNDTTLSTMKQLADFLELEPLRDICMPRISSSFTLRHRIPEKQGIRNLAIDHRKTASRCSFVDISLSKTTEFGTTICNQTFMNLYQSDVPRLICIKAVDVDEPLIEKILYDNLETLFRSKGTETVKIDGINPSKQFICSLCSMVAGSPNRPSSIIIAGADKEDNELIRQALLHQTSLAEQERHKTFEGRIRRAF